MPQHEISRFFKHAKPEPEPSPTPPPLPSKRNGPDIPKPAKRPKSTTTKLKDKTLTHFEQQILLFKLSHMDKILLIQSGYRYKAFGEDAQIISRILNIKLTDGKISFNLSNPSPQDHLYSTFAQASIPLDRLLIHVRRLIVKGFKVGVVDQIETASIRAESKIKNKIFDRKLTKVYSPGTFIDDEDLQKTVTGKSIICIAENTREISLMAINVYFASIIYDQFVDDFTRFNLESRLHHIEPIEIITLGTISKETSQCIKNFQRINREGMVEISLVNQNEPTLENPEELIDHCISKIDPDLETLSLFKNFPWQIQKCLYTLINYLEEFNLLSAFKYKTNYKNFADVDHNIILDASVLKSLEIFANATNGTDQGSLIHILDHTLTKFGHRMLKNWIARPLMDKQLISERHDTVDWIMKKMNSLQVERVQNILKGCTDLELIFSRIHNNKSNRKEVYLFLRKLNEILSIFRNMNDQLISEDVLGSNLMFSIFQELKKLSQNELFNIDEFWKMIYSPAAMDQNSNSHITEYFNDKFFGYDEILKHQSSIANVLKLIDLELVNARKITKNRDLKFIKVNGEPFLIEVRKSNIKHVPSDWIRINATTNCARFRTLEVESLYKKLKYNEDMLKQTCNHLFEEFTTRITQFQPQISKLIKELATFDALRSLAICSLNNDYSKPKIVDAPIINLKNSRNPIAERLIKEKPTFTLASQSSLPNSSQSTFTQPTTYIGNDFQMQYSKINESRIALITGPNMGGKSSLMRQVALIVILSQIGCFIPCDKGSMIGIFSEICIRLGSNDDIFQGKSTFQVELTECKRILDVCNENKGNSLILIDELGRGTSTIDGCSIAWSVLKYLANDVGSNTVVLFVTHFKELEAFENITSGIVKNYHMGYRFIGSKETMVEDEQNIMFTYELKPGCSSGSFGVYCAKIAGIPANVINKAHSISREMETQHSYNKTRKALKALQNRELDKLSEMADTL